MLKVGSKVWFKEFVCEGHILEEEHEAVVVDIEQTRQSLPNPDGSYRIVMAPSYLMYTTKVKGKTTLKRNDYLLITDQGKIFEFATHSFETYLKLGHAKVIS